MRLLSASAAGLLMASASAAAGASAALFEVAYTNEQGYDVWEHPSIEGLEMVALPEVAFYMGAQDETLANCFSAPWDGTAREHAVALSPYSIAATEITVQQYCDFLNDAMSAGYVEVYKTTSEDAWYWENEDDDFGSEHDFSFVRGTDKAGDLAGKWMTWLDPKADTDWVPEDTNHIDFDHDAGKFVVDGAEYKDWPMACVSWYGATAFASWYGMELPTEAQWEYAAGGGADGKTDPKYMYPSASGYLTTAEMNFNGETMGRGDVSMAAEEMPTVGHPVSVRSYPANAHGIYEMGGNVFEWCQDFYDDDYYTLCTTDPDSLECAADGTMINPKGPTDMVEAVQGDECNGGPMLDFDCNTHCRRGGSFNYYSETTCSVYRGHGLAHRMTNHFGFRVVDWSGVTGSL